MGITAAAAAVRLVGLPGQPGGLYPDEAAEGLDAYRLLHEPGFHPLFFDDDGGREPLFAYVVAGAFRVLGSSAGVLRGVAAVLGVAGVLATLLALRRFGPWVALAGAAWAAGSLWLIAVARDGMRNVLVPLAGALALWALLRFAGRPGRGAAALAGAMAALGLWTYQPLKLLPLLIGLWLLWVRHADPERWRLWRPLLPWMAAAYAVVALPMVAVAVTDPVGYFGRGVAVSPANPQHGLSGILGHWAGTLGMFFVSGDPNARHDVDALPLLGVPLTLLALLGAWRCWRRRAEPGHALLLLGIPVFLLPPLVAVEGGTPHFLRSLGLAPHLAGLIGLGCAAAVEAVRRRSTWRWAGGLTAAACAALLMGLGAASAHAYFTRPVAARYGAYSFNVVRLAELAAAAGPRACVVIDGYQAMVVRFLDASDPPTLLTPGQPQAVPRGSRVLALDRGSLRDTVGAAAAAGARPVAWDPGGAPVVWETTT